MLMNSSALATRFIPTDNDVANRNGCEINVGAAQNPIPKWAVNLKRTLYAVRVPTREPNRERGYDAKECEWECPQYF
jgi:hypothetical protein